MARGFEVERPHAIALASPTEAPSAQDALAYPTERLLLAVRVFKIVDEPFVVILGAGVTVPLNRTRFLYLWRHPQVGKLPTVDVLRVVLFRDLLARFQQANLHTCFGELLGGPAARGTGANHDGVKRFGWNLNLHYSRVYRPAIPIG